MKKTFTCFILLLVPFLFRPFLVSAQDIDPFCIAGNPQSGIRTALGCFMANDPKQAITQILGWAITVGGGLAFLITVYAGYSITTAQGDPKKMQAASELLTSAISGLILIIFSVVILNIVGVNVLGLNRFGFNI